MPVEQHIFHLVNNGAWTHPALDRAMFLVSAWNVWWPLVALVCLGFLVCGGFRARAFVLVAAAAVGITDGLIVSPLKKISNRSRPHESVEGVRHIERDRTVASRWEAAFVRPLDINVSAQPQQPPRRANSFPSAHSANNFAVAGVALMFFRRRAWPFLVFAATVAYSRLHLGVHWPFDVVVGTCIGLVVGMLTTLLVDRLWHHIAPRFPKLATIHPSLYCQ